MYFDELEVGQTAEFTKTVTEADVILFAGITGDLNPVHIDEVAASRSRFGGRVVHGMFSASLISTVLGTRLPGPGTIYLQQTLRFTAPVRIGETVTAFVEVAELFPEKRHVRMVTAVSTHVGQAVVGGEALVMVPARPAKREAK